MNDDEPGCGMPWAMPVLAVLALGAIFGLNAVAGVVLRLLGWK